MTSIPHLLLLPLAGLAIYAAAMLAGKIRNPRTIVAPGEPAESDLTSLLALPIGKILRGETVYERIYQGQIKRLGLMNVAPIQEAATAAIEATHDCHIVAADLLRFATAIDAAASVQGRLAFIEHAQTITQQAITSSPYPGVVRTADQFQAYNDRALAFMRWLLSSDWEKREDMSFEEAFIEHSPDMADNPEMIKTVSNVISMYKANDNQLQVAACLAQIGLIYRGIFYVGILGRTGSALEREELLDKLKEALLVVTALSVEVVHFAGLAKALIEALAHTAQPKPTGHLDGVKAIGTYFAIYEGQLTQWKASAGPLRDALSITVASLAPTHR